MFFERGRPHIRSSWRGGAGWLGAPASREGADIVGEDTAEGGTSKLRVGVETGGVKIETCEIVEPDVRKGIGK